MKPLVLIMLLVYYISAPVIASDYVLGIFGNANMDDIIDGEDIEYVLGIIDGTNEATELADANNDGEIDEKDITQIELIIGGTETELKLIDGADRIVTVEKPVERVVVCFPHALETLRTLKVPKDNIVGAAKHWPEYNPGFFPEIDDIPDVGNRWDPNVEEILVLNPDLVMFTASSAYVDTSSTISSLEAVGIDVLCFSLNGLETYPEEIEALGYVLDREAEAKEFVDWRENILDTIETKVADISEDETPRVYFEAASGDDGYKIYGKYAYIALAGGDGIFSDQPGSYTSVNPEAIAAREPDIIVKVESAAGGYDMDAIDISELESTRDEVSSRDVLQYVSAVKKDRIYVISVHLLSFFGDSGCRSFIQLAYQAKWFHPELFEDLDPKAIHQEYLTRFQGLDIDLDENGVFVFPSEVIE